MRDNFYNILQIADDLTGPKGDRFSTYGDPVESFEEIADLATILTGKQLTSEDICKVQMAVKHIRHKYSPQNPDHLIDLCGYARILDDIKQHNDKYYEHLDKLNEETAYMDSIELHSEISHPECLGPCCECGIAEDCVGKMYEPPPDITIYDSSLVDIPTTPDFGEEEYPIHDYDKDYPCENA